MEIIEKYLNLYEEHEGQGSKFMSREDLSEFLLGFLKESNPFLIGFGLGKATTLHDIMHTVNNN